MVEAGLEAFGHHGFAGGAQILEIFAQDRADGVEIARDVRRARVLQLIDRARAVLMALRSDDANRAFWPQVSALLAKLGVP